MRTRRYDPDRKDRILEAALEVIADHGVAGTTHRSIAARADVPLGSTTYHFETLDDRINGGALKDKLLPSLVETVRQTAPDGKLYIVPSSANMDIIWYRTDWFKDAGLEAPKTWDEFAEWLRNFNEGAKGKVREEARSLGGPEDEVRDTLATDRFADAAGCKTHLARLAADERLREHVAVEGPYDIAAGDVRIHWVDVSGSGHRITEHRCLAEQLSARTFQLRLIEPALRAFHFSSPVLKSRHIRPALPKP